MDFADPAQRAVFFEVHSGLPREGPGDRATIDRALEFIGPLPPDPEILDIACGPGGQTIDLAELIPDARITAVDPWPPFLRDLEARATRAGVAQRIRAMPGDMSKLAFEPASFDLLWCEGAAYIMGLPEAMAAWKPLLRRGGALALSEPVWLKTERPERVRACWAEYPRMADVEAARACARKAGYEIVGDFVLSEAAWWTNYYGPLEASLDMVTPRHAGDPVAQAVLDEIRLEIDCYRHHADCYGYLFLVLRA